MARESDIGDVGEAELMWCADEDGFYFRKLFNCGKFSFIHASISSRQVVSVDVGRGQEEVGVVLRYSCVSSA